MEPRLSLIYVFLTLHGYFYCNTEARFRRITNELLGQINTRQMNYGVAVSDVDNDGNLDFIVAGYSGKNFVFKYNQITKKLEDIAQRNTAYEKLMDVRGQAIGVGACDIDGDGREEIYFLNTNQAYAGQSSYGDKLFKWVDGKYVNLFDDPLNVNMTVQFFAGRSVACVDRNGDGKYGIIVATYSNNGAGNFALIEVDEEKQRMAEQNGVQGTPLKNVASEARVDKSTGGRAVAVGPITNDNGRSDIYFGNEGNGYFRNPGENYLFKNSGNGQFVDIAKAAGVQDKYNTVRGLALADLNHDKKLDIVYGNWVGNHRVYIQKNTRDGRIRFENVASGSYAQPTAIRTVMVTDFNNDGVTEIFMNNIKFRNREQPNKLFDVVINERRRGGIEIVRKHIGDAIERDGYGTGGAYTDIDQDGVQELLLSHGESNSQQLEIYRSTHTGNNKWIRVRPYTKFGAPARGATVTLKTRNGDERLQVIDGGSGYLCQMEPVAHFGLGTAAIQPSQITVQWPDGKTAILNDPLVNRIHSVNYPSD